MNTDKIHLIELRQAIKDRNIILRRAYRAFGYDHGDDVDLWRREQKQVLDDISTMLDESP